MLIEQDMQQKMRAVAHAIAQQELEGLSVPPETVEDMRRAARGEIDQADVLRHIYERFTKVPYDPALCQHR